MLKWKTKVKMTMCQLSILMIWSRKGQGPQVITGLLAPSQILTSFNLSQCKNQYRQSQSLIKTRRMTRCHSSSSRTTSSTTSSFIKNAIPSKKSKNRLGASSTLHPKSILRLLLFKSLLKQPWHTLYHKDQSSPDEKRRIKPKKLSKIRRCKL